MAVLIKNMEMPDSCVECDFCGGMIMPDEMYVCDFPTDEAHGKDISENIENDTKPSWCPLCLSEPCEDDPRADVYYLAEKIGIHQLYALVVQLRGEPEPCEDAVSRAELLSAFPVDDEPTVTKSSLRMTINHLPFVTPKEQRWIPCSERLPGEKEKSYWVCTSGGYQCQARWTDDKFGLGVHATWGWHFLDCPQYDKITAWMPLPEPYRGEGEE